MKDLPSLKAVRAFEACYRLNSFTKAAKSLNVGQPAISHQIRSLEKDLGQVLFQKAGTSIKPTAAATLYYEDIAPALRAIEKASIRMRQTDRTHVVLATYPGLAAHWVMPRLNRLRNEDDTLPVHIVTADLNSDLMQKEWDCAILFQSEIQTLPENLSSLRLIDEAVVPMATKEIADRWQDYSVEDFLANAPLIHLDDPEGRWMSWQDWRDHKCPKQRQIKTSTTVTNYGVAVNLALSGHGIMLGWLGVLADLNARGLLVPLDYSPIHTDKAYHLITTESFQKSPTYMRLINALLRG